MRTKAIMAKIEKIQESHKDLKSYPYLLDIVDPGQTGYEPNKGNVLICLLNIPLRKKEQKIILPGKKEDELEETSGMGVMINLAVVMEAPSDSFFKAGDIVNYNTTRIRFILEQPSTTNHVIVKGGKALLVFEGDLLGKYNDLIK